MVRDRDLAFGQLMLRLRMGIGLTQTGLAELLGVSRHAVGGWEAGESYPKTDRLKQLIVLGMHERAFTAGHEAEQIRLLWTAAHQKVLLDEVWLQRLLSRPAPTAAQTQVAPPHSAVAVVPDRRQQPRVDWGDALDVAAFCGRDDELAQLTRWAVEERCRVISVLGLGGIGKSALAVTLMHRLTPHFEVVIWRSLRDAPPCDVLLDGCLQVLAPQAVPNLDDSLAARLQVLMQLLRERRVLLVLDNLESLLEEGIDSGGMRAGFEGYSRLLQQVGETTHQSCLVFTSREKPVELAPLESKRSPVRSLRLGGLGVSAGAQLLVKHELVASPDDTARLIERYQGNPLALHIVAQTIVELFGGEVAPLLAQNGAVFGGITQLLDQQVARFSALEHTVFYWLAILREPANLAELVAVLSVPTSPTHVLDALAGLQRRNMIEQGQQAGSFTLHPVVLEYATARLVAEASREIDQPKLELLSAHGLCLAQAKEYVRRTQEQLLLLPVLARLQSRRLTNADIEVLLRSQLDRLRDTEQQSHGYGPANLLALLRALRGHLRGLDFSRLALRGVSLQDVAMQDVALSGSVIQDCVFAETFDDILAVAISDRGAYWAASSRRGELRVWVGGGVTLRQVWRGHTDMVWALACSPDGRGLASGSWDGTVKLWDVATGALRWSGRHGSHMHLVAFSPDGSLLASSGPEGTVWLWDVESGTQLQALPHPAGVLAVSWSPGGELLVSGDVDGNMRLWELPQAGPPRCIQTIAAHANNVDGLAFTPDGRTLASASWDGTVKLWEVPGWRVQQTLTGHSGPVRRVVWSPDGSMLASCGFEPTIWLWDVERGSYRAALQGHSAPLTSLAFTPDSRLLISASEDGTLRVWDVGAGQSVRVTQGYVASLHDVAWSPDGALVAGGGTDRQMTIHAVAAGTPPRTLSGPCGVVFGVSWSSDGRWLASSEWLNTIRLWDPTSGAFLQVLGHPDDPDNYFYGVAWSPDGRRLAAGSSRWGVLVWDVTTRRLAWAATPFPTWIRPVAWSPDGTRIAGGGDDGTVYVWDASDGTLVGRLGGHQGMIMGLAWSPDGARLAAGGGGSGRGELAAWDARSGERVGIISALAGVVSAVAWNADKGLVVSGDVQGDLRWWDVASGQCVQARQAHRGTVQALALSPGGRRLASCGDDGAIVLWDLDSGEPLQTLRRDRPYERMDITGLSGVTDAQRASLIDLGALVQIRDQTSLPATIANYAERPARSDQSDPTGLHMLASSFAGRDDELHQIAKLLANPACRLLTLLGPGGAGKTRLALEVASDQAAAFGGGVVVVALDEVETSQRLVFAISAALGLSPNDNSDPVALLLAYLRPRRRLLILDRFEHLLDGAALLAQILANAPQVKLLLTSRARLDLQAEWLLDIHG